MDLSDIVAQLTGEISDALISIRNYAEPRSVRIIAPCVQGLEDSMRRLEGLEERVSSIPESQARAELVTIIRNLSRTFDQLKRSQQVDPSWYEGDPGTGVPSAVTTAKEILGL